MEGDSVENYALKIDGYKRYRCDSCDYIALQKKVMSDHLCSKKHRDNLKIKSSIPVIMKVAISEPIQIINNNIINEERINNSPPKNKLKGKTYLSKNCSNALSIDTSIHFLEHWGRQLELTVEDIEKRTANDPNQFILYYFMKLKNEIGINNFPFRCLDVNRRKIYYNDIATGWTEDIGHLQTLKLIRNIFSNTILTAAYYHKCNELNINQDDTTETNVKYIHWGYDRKSNQEPSQNKSKKQAEQEIIEALDFICQLFQVEEED